MRIAHVTVRFGPGGGIVQIIRETSRRLRALGDEVEVFTSRPVLPGPAPRADAPSAPEELPVHRFPYGRTERLKFPFYVGLNEALARSGADVIHAHQHRNAYVLQAAHAARRLKVPLVVSTYYHPAYRREPLPKRATIRLLDFGFGLMAYERAQGLIALSNLEVGIVRRFAPTPPIHVVPPGIDFARWSDASSDLPDPRRPPEYFLYAGRIDWTKGLVYLLRAMALLPPGVRRPLVLAGPDWGVRAELEAEARRLGIGDAVTFLGHVPDDRAYRGIIRGATALVLPSESESFGIVLLEAMAARTPVIGSNVWAIPEVLDGGRAGRLVPYADPNALAAALAAVVREPDETRRQVERGFERARSMDWSVTTRAFRAIYEEIVRR